MIKNYADVFKEENVFEQYFGEFFGIVLISV
jgi:hypothetical protein